MTEVEANTSNPSSTDTISVMRQLANSITLQNETSRKTNEIYKAEYSRRSKKDEIKKDRLKKLHKSILNQVLMLAATYKDFDGVTELVPPL